MRQQHHVLRIEVIVHNTKAYRWGRSLPCFSEIISRFWGILERFANALNCINACFVSDETLERRSAVPRWEVLTSPSPECAGRAEAVLDRSASPKGFTTADLARPVHSDERPARV